jgi:uncharacterized protein
MKVFYEKYQNTLLCGTEMWRNIVMYRKMFNVLESLAEHFYEFCSYKWAQNGLGLSKKVLKKVYHDNAVKVLKMK